MIAVSSADAPRSLRSRSGSSRVRTKAIVNATIGWSKRLYTAAPS